MPACVLEVEPHPLWVERDGGFAHHVESRTVLRLPGRQAVSAEKKPEGARRFHGSYGTRPNRAAGIAISAGGWYPSQAARFSRGVGRTSRSMTGAPARRHGRRHIITRPAAPRRAGRRMTGPRTLRDDACRRGLAITSSVRLGVERACRCSAAGHPLDTFVGSVFQVAIKYEGDYMKSARKEGVDSQHLLHHITLATNHTILHRLDTIEAAAVAACRGLLPKGGPVPGFPGFRVEVLGARAFTIYFGRIPLVTCGIGEGRDDTWQTLARCQGTFCRVTATPPVSRWLAVVLLPSLILLEFKDIIWLGDFERCMAAAMIYEADCSG